MSARPAGARRARPEIGSKKAGPPAQGCEIFAWTTFLKPSFCARRAEQVEDSCGYFTPLMNAMQVLFGKLADRLLTGCSPAGLHRRFKRGLCLHGAENVQ